MSRRRLLRGLMVVSWALLLGAVALWWVVSEDRITPANAARINPGMPLAAVNQLLGGQGQVATDPVPGAAGENHYVWEGKRGTIHVAFRGDLTATGPAGFTAGDSPLARFYNWAGW
jgi:hypothetical protein